MKHDIGTRIPIETLGVGFVQEVVVPASGHDNVGHAPRTQPFDYRAAKKASAARDDNTGADERGSGVRIRH
jgi:hypothetical protein